MTTSVETRPHRAPAAKSMDPAQRAAAYAREGPVIITGGPGSGKTHTLVRRIKALLDGNAKPATVTFLSYTSRAANTAREQISTLIEDEDVTKRLWFGTFHAYASAYLRQTGSWAVQRTPHYSLWDTEQAKENIQEILEAYPGEMDLGLREVAQFQNWMGLNKSRWKEAPDNPRQAFWHTLKELYDDQKEKQNVLDLDDLIYMAVLAMERDPKTASIWANIRSRHILVDEFQDVTPLQYRMLELMTGPTRSVTLASDPNQCIYSWTGADRRLLERFTYDHPQTEIHHLKLNHRSTKTLVEIGERISIQENFTGLTEAYQGAIRPEGPRPKVVDSAGLIEEMAVTLKEQMLKLNANGIEWEDMALLARRKEALEAAQPALKNAGIPYHVAGELRNKNRDQARRFLALLTCLINPMDIGNFRNAASIESGDTRRGLNSETAKRVARIAEEDEINLIQAAAIDLAAMKPNARNRDGLEYIVNVWTKLNDLLEENLLSLIDFVEYTLRTMEANNKKGPGPSMTPGVSDEITQILTLSESHARLNREELRDELARFLEMLKGVNHPELVDEETEDPFDAKPGVTLSTIHKAKGLQWKVVWILDASDHVIPGRAGVHDSADIDEEHRLFYVASTRGTDLLHYCNASRQGPDGQGEPTRFLEPLRADTDLIRV